MIFKIKYEVLRNIIYYIIKFTNIYIYATENGKLSSIMI